MATHSSSCAAEKLDTPIARIFPAFEECRACRRRLRDRLRRRPMELVEIDMVDAETPQAGVAFRGHVGGRRGARGSVAVDAQAELREDQRPLRRRQLLDGASHDLFREPGTVDGSGVDPVDAMVDGGMNRLGALCLLLPAPHVAADCPVPKPIVEMSYPLLPSVRRCMHAPGQNYTCPRALSGRWPAPSRGDYNVSCSWRLESVAARGVRSSS